MLYKKFRGFFLHHTGGQFLLFDKENIKIRNVCSQRTEFKWAKEKEKERDYVTLQRVGSKCGKNTLARALNKSSRRLFFSFRFYPPLPLKKSQKIKKQETENEVIKHSPGHDKHTCNISCVTNVLIEDTYSGENKNEGVSISASRQSPFEKIEQSKRRRI